MFLFRGSNGLRVLDTDPPGKLERVNAIIARRRSNFEADVTVLCILVERLIGAKGCTPNLHSLFCSMTSLVRTKGHPKFELMIERLMGFLKKRVRGPLRECEAILNDLLALSRAQLLQQHPSYLPDDREVLNSARRMQPDRHFKGEGDLTFAGTVSGFGRISPY